MLRAYTSTQEAIRISKSESNNRGPAQKWRLCTRPYFASIFFWLPSRNMMTSGVVVYGAVP